MGFVMSKFNQNGGVPRADSVLVRPVHPIRAWLLGLIFAGSLVPFTIAPKLSGNVSSRYMTIEGLVERGTLAIDASPLLAGSGSPDVVRFGRHLYSDKPPVLPAMGAGVYAILVPLGIRFSGSAAQFVLANLVLVISIVGVASALTLVWLRQLLQTIPIDRRLADLLTLGFGFGSLLFTYGVTFNNHSVAAALLTGCFALAILENPDGKRVKFTRALAGFLAGLAATIDLPPGALLLAGIAAWQTVKFRKLPLPFLAGALPPLLLHCLLQSAVTGSPLPAEMYPKAFEYPGSYWMTAAGAWKETVPRWQFGLEFLFGHQGWFTITPVLFFLPVGLAFVLARRTDPLWPAAALIAGMVLVLVVYYVWGVRRTDFAGQSFGTRHMLAITPLCFFFAIVGLQRLHRRAVTIVFLALIAAGGIYAVSGANDPWSRVEKRAQTNTAVRMLQKLVIYPWSSYRR